MSGVESPESAPAPVEEAAAVIEPAAETAAPSAIEGAPDAPVEEVAGAAPAEPAPTEAAPETPPETPAEAAPETQEKPAEVEAAPEPPTYGEFKLPEGFEAPAERLTEFTSVLGKHGLSQEAGQELLDLHAATVKQVAEAMSQHQIDTFSETRAGWRKDVDKRFGNRVNTTLEDAKWMVSELVPDAAARREVWDVFSFTGVGDHPAMIDLLARGAKRLRERNAPAPSLPARPAPADPANRRYGEPRR